ncbi:MAG: PhnA domain-containing protein [Marinagarivorans sp.]|nr:PhnA domain-containing protein [Marinagarivorans sp.]
MSIDSQLLARADHKCELCGSTDNYQVFAVPHSDGRLDSDILACETCRVQLPEGNALEANHWRCLSDSMWSTTPAVQVLAWRLLGRLEGESWAHDLRDMLYLDDVLKAWAEAGIVVEDANAVDCRDSNGVRLAAGDNVVIIKDLPVKGTSLVAKRGTAVRGISLTSNPEHIEGRVEGQRIVILSCFVKKS